MDSQISIGASRHLYEALKFNGNDFAVTFPCNWTSLLLNFLAQDGDITHIPVTREEEGIGVAAGAYLGGKKPVIIMQSSGIGNSLNALASLHLTYKIPVLILISHRGDKEETIVAQNRMGQALKKLLVSIEIPYFDLFDINEAETTISNASKLAVIEEKPVSVILSPQFLLDQSETEKNQRN